MTILLNAHLTQMTMLQQSEDNFKASERFILSNLLHHRFLSVDANAVRRSVEGMVLKFQIHGLSDRGQQLKSLVNEFLQSCNFKDHGTVSMFGIRTSSVFHVFNVIVKLYLISIFVQVDIQWSLLSLLLLLGENPTNILNEDESLLEISISPETEEVFDWTAHLKEGVEEFHQDWSDSPSDVSDCICWFILCFLFCF